MPLRLAPVVSVQVPLRLRAVHVALAIPLLNLGRGGRAFEDGLQSCLFGANRDGRIHARRA